MKFSQVRQIFFLCVLFFMGLDFAHGQERFSVSIQGKERLLPSFQRRAELRLARSTKFCRGFTMPKKVGSWQCSSTGEGIKKCVAQYKCGLINESFSRITETRRLRNELKQVGMTKTKFPMIVSKKPLQTPNRRRYADVVKSQREERRLSQKRELRERIKARTQRVKKELTEFDEFAQLEKELAIETKRTTPEERKETLDDFSKVTMAEDRRQIENNQEEYAPFVLEREKSNSGDEEIIRIKKRGEEVVDTSPIKLFSFSTALASIGDANGNSVATVDLAWTPRWQFSSSLAARGRVGGHFFSVEIVEGEDPETFIVYDVAAELEWFPWDATGFYATGGLGIQSWTSTTGGAFSVVSLGAGYLFNYSKGKILDRVFLNYSQVGNENSNTELKLGVGVTF